MDLPALVDFNLVATHGGFGRASRASGRPKATLSRKVSELEASLGVRLIDRGSRTLRLTGEGRALHERTLGPLAEIIEAEQAVASGSSIPAGKLRVSAPIVLAHVLLPKLATNFVAAYPHVDLEIIAEDRKVDPVDDNYDLVIRIDPEPGRAACWTPYPRGRTLAGSTARDCGCSSFGAGGCRSRPSGGRPGWHP